MEKVSKVSLSLLVESAGNKSNIMSRSILLMYSLVAACENLCMCALLWAFSCDCVEMSTGRNGWKNMMLNGHDRGIVFLWRTCEKECYSWTVNYIHQQCRSTVQGWFEDYRFRFFLVTLSTVTVKLVRMGLLSALQVSSGSMNPDEHDIWFLTGCWSCHRLPNSI